MFKAVLSSAVVAGCVALGSTAALADDYPLHFRVVHVSSHNKHGFELGDGEADLTENGQTNGVMFTYSCNTKIAPSFGSEFYQAKWKKQGKEIQIAAGVVGSEHTDFCDVKLDVKPYVFIHSGGEMTTLTQEEFTAWKAAHPDRTF